MKFPSLPKSPKKRRRPLLLGALFLIAIVPAAIYLTRNPGLVSADSFFGFDEGYGSTVSDGSGSASGTITGATWKDESLCHTGKCLYFDGSDWISFGDESTYDFAAADAWTVQFWFRHGPATATEVIMQKYEGTGGDGGWRIQMESDGDISFGVDDANGGFADDTVTSTTADYDDNRWHHVSAVKDGTTGIYLYIDNVLVASDETIGSTGTLANDDTFYIGDSLGADGGDEYVGFLDGVKIYTSSARTQAEVYADYLGSEGDRGTAASFRETTGSLSDGLVGYWRMDEGGIDTEGETLVDSSGNNYNATLYGDNSTGDNGTGMDCTTAAAYGSGCTFDGTDDYIQYTNSIVTDYPVTVSAWMNTSTQNKTGIFLGSNSTAWSYFSVRSCSGSSNYSIVTRDSTTNHEICGSTALGGTWKHVVGIWYSDSKRELYVDGQLENESTTQVDFPSGINRFTLGRRDSNSAAEYWNGSIDEVRIYNRALTPAEVQDLYEWAPGPVIYLSLDENSGTAVYDRSGNEYTTSLEGLGAGDWNIGRIGAALTFDASTSRLLVTDEDADMSVNSFTYAAWIRPNSFAADVVMSNRDGNDDGFVMETYDPTDTIVCSYNATDAPAGSNYTMTAQTWNHVACTSDGSTLRTYVNGVLAATAAVTGDIAESTDLAIGARNWGTVNAVFDGTIDDVRIYSYARSATQIIQDMNGGQSLGGSMESSKLHHYKFDERYGDTAYDSGSGGLNGDLGGSGTTCPQSADSACPTWSNAGKMGGGIDFDTSATTDDYIDIGTSTISDYPFTFSAWVNSAASSDGAIVGLYETAAGNDGVWIQVGASTASLGADGSTSTTLNSTTDVTDSTWHHIAGVFVSDNLRYLYVDGVLEGTDTTSVDFDSAWTVLSLGQRYNSPRDTYLDGIVDEVKVYSTALTQEEILIDMNAGSAAAMGGVLGTREQDMFVDGAMTDPILHFDFNENSGTTEIYDKSGNGEVGTMEGTMTASDWIPSPRGSALAFDGTDDQIDFHSSGFASNFNGDNGTVLAWFREQNWGTGAKYIIRIAVDGNNDLFMQKSTTNTVLWRFESGGNLDQHSHTFSDTGWNQMAMTWDYANDSIVYYMNGEVISTDTGINANRWVGSPVADLTCIGSLNCGATTSQWDGDLDDIKVYDYTLTQAQIMYEYNRGAPVGWWRFDECSGTTAYDVMGNSDGTITPGTGNSAGTCSGTTGDMWADGTTGKLNASLEFDGADDYVDTNLTTHYDQTSVTAWIYLDSWGETSKGRIFDKRDAGSEVMVWYVKNDGAEARMQFFRTFSTQGGDWYVPNSSLSTGQWYHVALTYDETDTTNDAVMYINGQTQSMTEGQAPIGTPTDNADPYIIGNRTAGDRSFEGQIDDFRIYNYILSASQVRSIMQAGAVRFE